MRSRTCRQDNCESRACTCISHISQFAFQCPSRRHSLFFKMATSLQSARGSFHASGSLGHQLRQCQLGKQARQCRRPADTVALFGFLKKDKSSSRATREELKDELLSTVRSVKRGVAATEDDKETIERLSKQLERMNPTKKTLESELTSGKWILEYTTSESILGLNKPPFLRPQGPIYQTLDVGSLKASNQETWPFFNAVSAELIPESKSKVLVQFKQFKILGLLPVQAPESAKGELDITYVDEDMRISRGNRGNLFVLTMGDSAVRL